jgi:hypothetical protein
MTGVKITEFPNATLPLTGTEIFPVVQAGVTKQTTVNQATSGAARILANIAALQALNLATTSLPTQVQLTSNYVAGDGGGVFRYDSTDTTSADNGGTVIVDALNRRWKRAFDSSLYEAAWFGVIADDATDNTNALNRAIVAAANSILMLPKGTFRSGVLTLLTPIHIMGALTGASIWKRQANSNNFALTSTGVDGICLSNVTFNANLSQNAASGAHTAISFASCLNMKLTDVRFVDWRGTFSGLSVGAGVSISGGTGGVFTRVYTQNCYDGMVLFQHNYFWTYGCRHTTNVRSGMLIDDCDDWVDNDTFAVLCGNDVALDAACAGVLVQNSDRWVANSPYCSDSPYGYGYQIQINCDDWAVNSPRVLNNAWDGVGVTGGVSDVIRRGRVVNGYGANNRASNLAVNDASTNLTVIGFVDNGGSLQGINVFRSTAHLVGCYGAVTIWDAGVINALAIGAAGAGYTNGTYIGVPLVGPTWYTDGLGRSALTANITVAGGIVTVATINYAGNLALPPTSLTGLTAPSLPGGAGATFTITLVGANSNTCQGTTITDGHNGGTLRIQAGAITSLSIKDCDFTSIIGATSAIVPEFKTAGVRVLFRLLGANMNTTADQVLTKVGTFNSWTLVVGGGIKLVNPSVNMTTAVGGFYTGAGKTGDILVPASQTYSTASTPGTSSQQITASALGGGVRTETPIFSLTTPQGAAATADIYIFGVPLS